MTQKQQGKLVVPILGVEWGKLSIETHNNITQIEERTVEFIRYLYADDPKAATEILKRIGFVELR